MDVLVVVVSITFGTSKDRGLSFVLSIDIKIQVVGLIQTSHWLALLANVPSLNEYANKGQTNGLLNLNSFVDTVFSYLARVAVVSMSNEEIRS